MWNRGMFLWLIHEHFYIYKGRACPKLVCHRLGSVNPPPQSFVIYHKCIKQRGFFKFHFVNNLAMEIPIWTAIFPLAWAEIGSGWLGFQCIHVNSLHTPHFHRQSGDSARLTATSRPRPLVPGSDTCLCCSDSSTFCSKAWSQNYVATRNCGKTLRCRSASGQGEVAACAGRVELGWERRCAEAKARPFHALTCLRLSCSRNTVQVPAELWHQVAGLGSTRS